MWGQIAQQVFFAIGMIIFIQHYQPYESKFANRMETFNEVCVLCLTYIAMCFTEFVPDPEVRSNIGPYYIAANLFMIAVHIIILLAFSLKALVKVCKKYYHIYAKKDKNAV